MLVLTRKTQQQIQIGPNITITILQVKGQAVRVGIEAPKDVDVLRTELAERLARESTPSSPGIKGLGPQSGPAAGPSAGPGPLGRMMRCRAPRAGLAPAASPPKHTEPASLPNSPSRSPYAGRSRLAR